MNRIQQLFFLLILIGIIFSGCRKEGFITDPSANIELSTDSLVFDTLFTGIGSPVLEFLVRNVNDKPIQIERVYLENGAASSFRMNVDGVATFDTSNVEIRAKDSIYVFVEVTVDPNNDPNRIMVADKINFLTNGNLETVQLIAVGQNAYVHYNESICDEVWDNDLPHLIVGGVNVAEGCTLTIKEGVDVHLYSTVLNVDGTLLIEGEINELVSFTGISFDTSFFNVAGQWGGIYLRGPNARANVNYAYLRNPVVGFRTDSLNISSPDTNLVIKNTIIQNPFSVGILGFLSSIRASNVLITSPGQSAVSIEFGGIYDFYNLTCVSNENSSGTMLRVSNKFQVGIQLLGVADLKFNMYNTIIDGVEEEQVQIDIIDDATLFTEIQIQNCLVKSALGPGSPYFVNCVFNQDPLFIDKELLDYQIQIESPCVDNGQALIDIPANDLLGFPRIGLPDIGCFEFHP